MLTTDVRATSADAFDRLDVENLSVWFGAGAAPLVAVDGISFSVKRGEHLGIIGESGSGKTVTSLAALGFERGRPGIVGPLADLYFTGHWVQPGGGITPVIVSAMQVAETVLGGRSWKGPSGFQARTEPEPVPATGFRAATGGPS